MRYAIALVVAVTLVTGAMVAAQEKEPPEKLLFHTKAGDVTFTHSQHISREKGECATCHKTLWPQSTGEPLKSSDGCRTCHHAGGSAFEMKGNCVKCHPEGSAKIPANPSTLGIGAIPAMVPVSRQARVLRVWRGVPDKRTQNAVLLALRTS